MQLSAEFLNFEAVYAKLDSKTLLDPPLRTMLHAIGETITTDAAANAPRWQDGQIADSKFHDVTQEGDTWTLAFGFKKETACVFGGNTKVKTKDGKKNITKIRPGDYVLTQTNEYRKVLAVSAIPASSKPSLVEIKVRHGKRQNHTLTVTDDHKILVFRDGRNKWIAAGELQDTDKLYSPHRTPYNRGMGRTAVCVQCGKTINALTRGQPPTAATKYCNLECRTAYWNKGNNPHLGMKRSDASRDAMKKASRRRFDLHPETHPNRILAQRGYKTDTEATVEKWLERRGLSFEPQVKIGCHIVDFFIPKHNLVIEADGAYWHRNQEKDVVRDREILQEKPDLRLIHIHFFDKRFSPPLDQNPLPGVHYVPVNPSPESFVEPESFDAVEIVSIRKWSYMEPKGSGARAKVYDISVEGVHSFVVNGILISNCYLEYGTGLLAEGPGPRKGKAHFPPPNALEPWAKAHGWPSGWMLSRAIGQRGGLRPRYFLRDAKDREMAQIDSRLSDLSNAIVRIWDS